jgi:hypothetical protein
VDAARLAADAGGLDHRDDRSMQSARLDALDLDEQSIARRRPGHEHDAPVHASDAVAAGGEIIDRDLEPGADVPCGSHACILAKREARCPNQSDSGPRSVGLARGQGSSV